MSAYNLLIAAYVLIVSFLTHAACAQISFSSIPCNTRRTRIVGGVEADQDELPFMVSLTRRGGHFCGATIISEQWILSAGHCICNGLNKFVKPIQIHGVMGLHSTSNNLKDIRDGRGRSHPVQVKFKSIVPHPNYRCESVKNDIALLELEHPITFSLSIQPTCLTLDSSEQVHENTVATVSGWGWTHEDRESGQPANVLRKASVKVWSNKECAKSYQLNGKTKSFLADTQMCAGFEDGGVDSCWADSGGPLISEKKVLIGVVSTGVGCARPGLPGIYTRVGKYISWIQSVLNH